MELGYKDLADYARQVWNATSLTDKKLAAHHMIAEMRYKDKSEAFKRQLAKLNCPKRIDSFAANLVLVDSDKVIK